MIEVPRDKTGTRTAKDHLLGDVVQQVVGPLFRGWPRRRAGPSVKVDSGDIDGSYPEGGQLNSAQLILLVWPQDQDLASRN